jgi:hypothetical protein
MVLPRFTAEISNNFPYQWIFTSQLQAYINAAILTMSSVLNLQQIWQPVH